MSLEGEAGRREVIYPVRKQITGERRAALSALGGVATGAATLASVILVIEAASARASNKTSSASVWRGLSNRRM